MCVRLRTSGVAANSASFVVLLHCGSRCYLCLFWGKGGTSQWAACDLHCTRDAGCLRCTGISQPCVNVLLMSWLHDRGRQHSDLLGA
jgi:hypothetical protein